MKPASVVPAPAPRPEHAPASSAAVACDVAGQLAGGVAHDFNNLLTAILGFVDLLSMRGDLPQEVLEDLEEIGKAGRLGASLTGRLMAYSRRGRSNPRSIDLNQVLVSVAPQLRRLLGDAIVLDVAPDPGLHRVLADAAQLEQVFVELMLNARAAMPSPGRVTISTANLPLVTDAGTGHHDRSGGQYVMLTVADTGLGMDAGTTATLFDPGFMPGSRGKGISLGLATVRGIVEAGGGSIAVRSAPGRGTTFTIHLPVSPVVDLPVAH